MKRSANSSAWRSSSLLLVAAGVGILTGFAETSFLQAQRLVFGRIVFLGRHAWWMKPVAEAGLFLVVTLAVLFVARALGRSSPSRTILSLIAGLASLSVLLLVPQVHLAARLLLAGGIGFQLGRVADPRLEGRERLGRRLAVLVLLVAGAAGALRIAFANRSAGLAGAAREGVPNLLLLVLDTVRARSLSAYGHAKPTTTTLERVASEGILFERAIAPAPWTLPSHASMFTGRDAHRLSADWRTPLDDSEPTIAEVLAAAGYGTAGFVANTGYAGWESGLDRGFEHYEDHPISIRQLIVESAIARWMIGTELARRLAGRDENFVRKSARDVNDAFLRWLDGGAGQPFFAFLNYYDAHGPYQPPEPFRSGLAEGAPRGGFSPLHRWLEDPFGPPPTADELQPELWAYEASIAYMDAEIGRLLEQLERRGVLSSTVLIVTSDHGEEFGEHDTYDHGNSLYLDGLHVPLIVRHPGLPAGTRVGWTVSTKRLAATLAEFAHVDGAGFDGPSLLASLGATPMGPSAPVLSHVSYAPRLPADFPVSRGDMSALTDGDWHFIRNGDGIEELYRIASGLVESRDLADVPEGRGIADSLGRLLDERLRTDR